MSSGYRINVAVLSQWYLGKGAGGVSRNKCGEYSGAGTRLACMAGELVEGGMYEQYHGFELG